MSGEPCSHGLARRLGPFDATMLVMGGIIGSGIFVNPAEVARLVETPWLIVGVWVLGGLIAMAGALVYADLADRRPYVGGQYAYLRDDLICMAAEHGVTAFPRWAGGDTELLDGLLRSKYDTAIVPGRWFDMPNHFRVSLGGETDMVKVGLSRLGSALDELA